MREEYEIIHKARIQGEILKIGLYAVIQYIESANKPANDISPDTYLKGEMVAFQDIAALTPACRVMDVAEDLWLEEVLRSEQENWSMPL